MRPDVEKLFPTMRRELAELCHAQWSGWMKYLFSKCVTNLEPGCMILPRWAVDRWMRQMEAAYPALSDSEKDSDLKEADRFMAILARHLESSVASPAHG